MAPIIPFQVSVPDDDLSALQQRLALTTLPAEVSFSEDWAFGAPLEDIKRLLHHWRNGYDWKKHEARINSSLPQFTTTVQIEKFGEVGMHLVHQRSEKADAIPLLFVHGWPGHFLEVSKILPLLTNPPDGQQAFHVVAPSLPNFGFSDRIQTPGFSIRQYAESVHQIMLSLGYKQYVTQGGDWGSHITRILAHLHPEASLAHHINLVPVPSDPTFFSSPAWYLTHHYKNTFSQSYKADRARNAWFRNEGRGYNLEQSTKPHTLGFSLRDSPVGLLAWIYEKLHDWTDNFPWTDDEILTWVCIYWFSKAGPDSASRIYYEANHTEKDVMELRFKHTTCPVGLAYFPRELQIPDTSVEGRLGNVVLSSKYDKGGHFAAYERPDALVDDLRAMFGSKGGASKIAKKLIDLKQ